MLEKMNKIFLLSNQMEVYQLLNIDDKKLKVWKLQRLLNFHQRLQI